MDNKQPVYFSFLWEYLLFQSPELAPPMVRPTVPDPQTGVRTSSPSALLVTRGPVCHVEGLVVLRSLGTCAQASSSELGPSEHAPAHTSGLRGELREGPHSSPRGRLL